jgi:hypothetical protein
MRTFVRRLVPVVGGRLFHLMKTGESTGKAAYSIAAYSPSAVCGQQGRRYGGGPRNSGARYRNIDWFPAADAEHSR